MPSRRPLHPQGRGEAPAPDGATVKGRAIPWGLPARFPTPAKCTSHLGFGLGRQEEARLQRCRWSSLSKGVSRVPGQGKTQFQARAGFCITIGSIVQLDLG